MTPSARAPTRPIHRVLVVDDDPDIRDLAAEALHSVAGWETHVAASGAAALEQAEVLQPDLILLDLMMPDMDGASTLCALRARPATAHIPVVLVTTRGHARASAVLCEADVAGFVAKPFDPVALPAELERLVARWRADARGRRGAAD